MGKRGKTSAKGGGVKGYVHREPLEKNARAHESDERKIAMLKRLKVTHLRNAVTKQIERMERYIPDEVRAYKKRKIDPQYALMGGARVAREYYKDPNDKSVPGDDDEKDLITEWGDTGILWDERCPNLEGRNLLSKMLKLGAGYHNITDQTKEAANVFERMLTYDNKDNLQAGQRLLRVYMDTAQAEKARALLDKLIGGGESGGEEKDETQAACYYYNRALIEFISFKLLEEEGSSQELCDEALRAAFQRNPYALYFLACHEIFLGQEGESEGSGVLEYTHYITGEKGMVASGDPAAYKKAMGLPTNKLGGDTAGGGSAADAEEENEHTKNDLIRDQKLAWGGVEDGISFLCEDLDLWRDVEGAVEWVQKFATEANGVEVPPQVAEEDEEEEAPELVQVGDKDTSKDTDKRKQEEEEEEGLEGEEEFDDEMAGFHNLTAQEKHQMYVGMFYTGVEMAGLLSTEEE